MSCLFKAMYQFRSTHDNIWCTRNCSTEVLCCRIDDFGKGSDCCTRRDVRNIYQDPSSLELKVLKDNKLTECKYLANSGVYDKEISNSIKCAISFRSHECLDILCKRAKRLEGNHEDEYGGTFIGAYLNSRTRNCCKGCGGQTLEKIVSYKLYVIDETSKFACNCFLKQKGLECFCNCTILDCLTTKDHVLDTCLRFLLSKVPIHPTKHEVNLEDQCVKGSDKEKISVSALFQASSILTDKPTCVEILLLFGLDPNNGGSHNIYALHKAICDQQLENIKLFHKHKANFNQLGNVFYRESSTWEEHTPLEVFVYINHNSESRYVEEDVNILFFLLQQNVHFRPNIVEKCTSDCNQLENNVPCMLKVLMGVPRTSLKIHDMMLAAGIRATCIKKKIRALRDLSLKSWCREAISGHIHNQGKTMFEVLKALTFPKYLKKYLIYYDYLEKAHEDNFLFVLLKHLE